MSKPVEGNPQRTLGWTADTELVREFDNPASVVDAVIATVTEAIEAWPELSEDPPLFDFVDAEHLDDLFGPDATEAGRWLPSVRFEFQGCGVTVLYGRTVRVIIERDPW